ncbi:MATE family efflux transporter [Massiliimalia massiliensis]|uniref:MATE family efflux transporter n=1 Tax=Massiliimalia massiliensis TaxID=1852384 RepID=UPI0009858CF0|nr:MATE family efflux transporter [Massiliimalia massiliensis]
MRIQLSEHFTYPKLLRFVFPSIIMMIFTSIYGVVDGLFVSNFVGKTPFAALNLIMPLLMILGALGFMIGTGGSAIVSKTLGEGKKEKANEYFSMLVYVTIVGGLILTVVGLIWIRPIAIAMGADDAMVEDCVLYGRILLVSLTAFMLQNVFQSFLITAERPRLGLAVTVAAGVTNIFLDFLFIVVFHWGLAGAAIATAISQAVGGVIPMIYFFSKNSSLLHLTRAKWHGRILIKACTNGSSELMTNISMSIVNILYNFQLMNLAGEDGIAAYGVIMYVNFIFVSIFIGYSIGCAPIVGYHYGAANHAELKSLFRKSLTFIGLTGFLLTVLALSLSPWLSKLFVGYDPVLYEMTNHGFRLYALSFLASGFSIFGSAFFTALSNGAVSAAISFLRTLVFQIVVVMILPIFLGIDGIWLAIVVAEAMALIVTIVFFVIKKEKYHYL